jgi:hypothetical protein
MPPSNTPASSLTELAIDAFDALFNEISGNVAVEMSFALSSAEDTCGARSPIMAKQTIAIFFNLFSPLVDERRIKGQGEFKVCLA